MNQEVIRSKIVEYSESIKNISSPSIGTNWLYNLILLKRSINDETEIYKLSKTFIINYISLLKESDYGYDTFNYEKIEKILCCIDYKAQISLLQFIISNMTKELPEYDKEWFVLKKNRIQIKDILQDFKLNKTLKLTALFAGLNIYTLFIALSLVFLTTYIILLPSPFSFLEIFEIKYDKYSSCFIVNHFLNILTLFADFDNEFKITPLNWFGTIMMVFGKVMFIILIVNFVFTKITNKISS
jgi:hypothetical protein